MSLIYRKRCEEMEKELIKYANLCILGYEKWKKCIQKSYPKTNEKNVYIGFDLSSKKETM